MCACNCEGAAGQRQRGRHLLLVRGSRVSLTPPAVEPRPVRLSALLLRSFAQSREACPVWTRTDGHASGPCRVLADVLSQPPREAHEGCVWYFLWTDFPPGSAVGLWWCGLLLQSTVRSLRAQGARAVAPWGAAIRVPPPRGSCFQIGPLGHLGAGVTRPTPDCGFVAPPGSFLFPNNFRAKIEVFYTTSLGIRKCYLIELILNWFLHKFD